jgi:3-oxoacyl-[acyl-carrier protein] reductase
MSTYLIIGASSGIGKKLAEQTGFPFHAQVSVSKGAIEGLTRALAAEFAPMSVTAIKSLP